MTRRVDNWPDRLTEFIDSRRDMPFAWGGNDCCTFCFDAVNVLTGRDVWPDRPWSTAMEAARVIEDTGGGLVGVWTAAMGARPSQNWREAARGDVVLAEQDGREVIMLCIGAQLCGPGIERLEFRPLADARLVWKV